MVEKTRIPIELRKWVAKFVTQSYISSGIQPRQGKRLKFQTGIILSI